MKKIISLVLAMIMVLAMGVSAFADEVFIPSVGNEFKVISARILDANGNKLADIEVGDDCLIITHITMVEGAPSIISGEIAQLIKVYNQLVSGELEIPYERYGYDSESAVIVDLYDATFICDEHPEALAPAGVTIEVVFEANVGPKDEIFAAAYKNNQWVPAVKAVNNGNGTVTCEFENFCPIAISIVDSSEGVTVKPAGDESNPNTGAPVFRAVAVVAAAACAVFARKK